MLQFEIKESKNSIQKFSDNEIKENDCKNYKNPKQGDHIIKSDVKGILYVLYCSITTESYKYAIELADKSKILLLSYQDNFEEDLTEEEKIELFEKIISTLKINKFPIININ